MNVCHVGLDADQVDRKKKSAVKRPLGGHATCQGKNGREIFTKLEFRRLGLSPHALPSLSLSPLCGVFSLRERGLCVNV
jgi:hypothetical protein